MGVPVTLSGRLTRAGVLIAAAAGAATVAAGCGSQVVTTSSATKSASPSTASPSGIIPGGPRSSGGSDLCSKQASVTRLVVSRVSALPQNHLHFAFPAGTTVRSPAQARAVAAAVCGLPRHAAWPDELPGRLGPQLPAQFRRWHQELSRGDRCGRWLRRGDRGRPGALDGPLARILDRPRACLGGQRSVRAAGQRPGPAACQPDHATPQPGPVSHRPGRPACAGRFAEPDTSRKGEHELGAIRLRRGDL